MKKLTLEELGILSVLYLEFFVKKCLWKSYEVYNKIDQWNFNRKLPK